MIRFVKKCAQRIHAGLSTIGLLALTACSTTDFFLGEDNRLTPNPLPVVQDTVGSEVIWRQKMGQPNKQGLAMLRAAAADGRVYAVSKAGRLLALSQETGQILQERDLGNGIVSGVQLAGQYLLLGTKNGDLLALDVGDFTELWRVSLGGQMLSLPAVANNIAIARTQNGAVTAIELATGHVMWRYQLIEPTFSVYGDASPVLVEDIVILTSNKGYFVVLDVRTGLPITEQRMALPRGIGRVAQLVDMDATPLVHQDRLFGAAYQSMVYAIDLKKGIPIWQQNATSTSQNFALSENALFLVDDNSHVIALEQNTGELRFSQAILQGRRLSAPVVWGDRVAVLDFEGYLTWLSQRDGRLLGQIRLAETGGATTPLLLNQVVIYQLDNGDLVAVRP